MISKRGVKEVLLDWGAYISARDNKVKTSLMAASAKGQKHLSPCSLMASSKEMVDPLLNRGADVSDTNILGQTALNIASSGHIACT